MILKLAAIVLGVIVAAVILLAQWSIAEGGDEDGK